MKLALKIINNQVYYFKTNSKHKIQEIIKIYDKKINIKEFLKLRNKHEQRTIY